ncbi:hypothetical protein [Anaeromyxobacter sp. SG26]|uniref:hypothetical protein n=1 Tax=Anaeromyxobacter sp. SG26 TaxID=2925407 RepID=UPI001F593442|nr:hypothetical protein [Anaeromyxobacter sp. SG26]
MLSDPLFGFLLVPFQGRDRIAIATLVVLIYLGIVHASVRIARDAGLSVGRLGFTMVFASTLAVLPVTLSTHLLRQCFATSALLWLFSRYSGIRLAALGAPIFAVHKGATAIAAIVMLASPPLCALGLAGAVPVLELLVPQQTLEYAVVSLATNVVAVIAFVGAALLLYRVVRKRSAKAARALGNSAALLTFFTIVFGPGVGLARTFTSCIIVAIPALVVLVLLAAERWDRRTRTLALLVATLLLIAVSATRDYLSPFVYDAGRLWW